MRKGTLEFTKPNFANAPICLSSLFIPKLKLNEIFEIFSIKKMPAKLAGIRFLSNPTQSNHIFPQIQSYLPYPAIA